MTKAAEEVEEEEEEGSDSSSEATCGSDSDAVTSL